jgi:hypothetical protein
MGTLFIRLGEPIWFHLPWQHTLGHGVYEVVSWLLMGTITAMIIKP